MKEFLSKLKNNQNLSFEESKAVFEILMAGKASEDEIFDFLTLLSSKGEVSDEIAGGVYVLINKAKPKKKYTHLKFKIFHPSSVNCIDLPSIFFKIGSFEKSFPNKRAIPNNIFIIVGLI